MQSVDVVFGASGFIGTHLIRKLLVSGRHVVGVDIKRPREVLDNVEYFNADVRDLSQLPTLPNIGCIYNFAAVHTTPGHQNHEYYETNIAGALEVTRFADRCGANEIVFTSSISVYGPGEETKQEKTSPRPVSAYGYSKLLAERIHLQWRDRNPDARLTIVRPAVVFGPGEGGNFTRLAKLLRKGFFVYPGRRDTIKACIYVDDLLRAIEFARHSEQSFKLLNGCYPGPYTLEQIVNALISVHFRGARTFMIPTGAVSAAARILGHMQFLNIGFHPDRVTKLVRSTDIFPHWLVEQGFQFPPTITSVMEKWDADTAGTFI